MECAMKRRFLAVLLAGVLAFSNMGAVLAADVSGSGSTDAEETFAAEEPAEDEGSEAPRFDFKSRKTMMKTAFREMKHRTVQSRASAARRKIRKRRKSPLIPMAQRAKRMRRRQTRR